MVIEFLIDLAADYVAEKAFNMSAESVLKYAVKFKEKSGLKKDLMDDMLKSVKTQNISEVTINMIERDDKDGKFFRDSIIKSIFLRNKKDLDWFIKNPPCPKENLIEIREDVEKIVNDLRAVAWNYETYRDIIGENEFQEMVILDLKSLRHDMEKLEKEVEMLKGNLVQVIANTIDPVTNFKGRENELKQLEKAVSENKIVFITGIGGIGKTELCRRFARDYSAKTDCKVVCVDYKNNNVPEGSNKMKITIATGVKTIVKDESTDIDILFESKVNAISYQKNVLLIIDGYVWNDDISTIEGLDCHILITTREIDRLAEYRQIPVLELKPDEAYDLLIDATNGKNSSWVLANREKLKDKLKEVHYHTLTVTLMGGLIARKWLTDGDTVDSVFDFNNTQVFSKKMGQNTVMGHMGTLFSLSTIEQKGLNIMRMAAMLPSSGMDYSIFINCSKADNEVVNDLYNTRWLEIRETGNKVILSVHPMIAELLWSVDTKPMISHDDVCFSFMKCFEQHMKSLDYMSSPIVLQLYSDIIVRFSDIAGDLDIDRGCTKDHLLMLIGYMDLLHKLGLYKVQPKMIEKCVKLESQIELENNQEKASVLWTIGYSYGNVGEYEAQLKYYLRALDLYESMPEYEDSKLAILYNNIGYAWGQLKELDKDLECCKRALDICRNASQPNDSNLAQSCNNVGYALIKKGEPEEGLRYCIEGLEIRKKLVPPIEMDLALSYNNIGYA